MATIYWNSTTGDPSQAGSWVGGVPTASDDVVCDARTQTSIAGGFTIDCASFRTFRGFRGALGVAGNPISLSNGANAILEGFGAAFFGGATIPGAIYVNSLNRVSAFTLSGLCSYLAVLNGKVNLVTGSQPSRMVIEAAFGRLPEVVDSGTLVIGNLYQDGGSYECAGRVISRATMASGSFIMGDTSDVGVMQVYGGTFINRSAVTLDELVALSGTVDFSTDDRAKTVTLAILGAGCELLPHPAVSFTTLLDLREAVPLLP